MNIYDGVPSFRYVSDDSDTSTTTQYIELWGSAQSALQSPSWERFLRGKRFWHDVCDERAYRIIHRIGQSATTRPEFYHLTFKYETYLFILDKDPLVFGYKIF